MTQSKFELIFSADTKQAKAATTELRGDVAALGTQAEKTSSALDAQTAALNREAEAVRRAAEAASKLSEAQAQADAAHASTGNAWETNDEVSARVGLKGTPANPLSAPHLAAQNNPREYVKELENVRRAEREGILTANDNAASQLRLTKSHDEKAAALRGVAIAAPLARLAVNGLAAAVIGSLTAWDDYSKSIKDVNAAASGLGRATAGTATDMEAAARAGANVAGISMKSARAMEAQMLRTGQIGSEHFEQLIAMSSDFAATMGVDAATAGQALAEMFADPARAAEALHRQYGLIDAATAQQAISLARANRISEAQAVLLEALPGQLADATQSTTAFGRAWQFVATSISDASDWLGRTIDKTLSDPSLDEQIAAMEEKYARFVAKIEELEKKQSRWNNGSLTNARAGAEQTRAELDALREQQRQQAEQEAQRKRTQEESRLSAPALKTAESSSATERVRREQELRDEIAKLELGLTVDSMNGTQRGMINTTIEAKKRALDALVNSHARALELDRLEIQIAHESNPVLRAELEARRARLELSGQEVDAATLSNAAERTRARVIGETIAAASAQVKDMQTELQARQRLNALVAQGTITGQDANRILEEETTLRPLIAAAALLEGKEKEELTGIIAALRDSYAQLAVEEKRASAQEYLRSGRERIAALQAELALVAETDATRSQVLAQLEAEQEIRRRGINIHSTEAQQIRSVATEQERLTRSLERQAEAWQLVRQSGEDAIDGLVDKVFSGDLSGALEDLAKDITSSLTTLGVANPLKNGLFGTDYATINDVGGIGGIISKLFGKDTVDASSIIQSALGSQTVGSMSVTAATVMINGSGLAGGLNGLLPSANDNSSGGLSAYAQAIKSIESGGNYGALGPITRTGDRAYGAYQIMGANIPSWSKAALGQSISIDEFLRNPALQDQIFGNRFGSYVNQYGPTGAAKAWFGGPGAVGGSGSITDILGTSVDQYAKKFNSALEKITGSTTVAAQGLNGLGTGLDAFGQNLSQMSATGGSGGGGGGLFGWLGNLFGGGNNYFPPAPTGGGAPLTTGMGLWNSGGFTGWGDPKDIAGFVHGREFVVKADVVSKPGVRPFLEALNAGRPGYASGGYVAEGGRPYPILPANSNAASATAQHRVETHIHNYAGANVHTEEEPDGRGGTRTNIIIEGSVSDALTRPGSAAHGSMSRYWGVKQRLAKR